MRGSALLCGVCCLVLVTMGQDISSTTSTDTSTSASISTDTSTNTATTASPSTGASLSTDNSTNTATTASPSTGASISTDNSTSTSGTADSPSTDTSLSTDNSTITSGTADSPSTDTSLSTDNSTITSGTADSPTTPSKMTCMPDSCGKSGATCVQLHIFYYCQCPLNFYFNNESLSCVQGVSFFGNLIIQNEIFNANKESEEYTNLYKKVKSDFQQSLESLAGYTETVITEISSAPPKLQTRKTRSTTSVSINVIHMFEQNSPVDYAKISAAIERNSQLGTYSKATICDNFYCDQETTNCTETAAALPTCTCKAGFYAFPSPNGVTSCRACESRCLITEFEHCVQKPDKPQLVCECLPGYQREKSANKCTKCSYGYSGQDCGDNSLLILVIIGSLGGALIICLIGAIIGVTLRSRRHRSDNERTQLINKNDKESLGSSSPAIGGLFPSVQPKSNQGQVNRASSPYENPETYARPTPSRDYDEDLWYEMSRKDRKF
ncbi:mucin-13 [Ascaphus truei]|uniref:mucin-13 n=1 Tax=Ascaphus truei TaxID=8439 RepID=UPI003F599F4A